jgi:outer membrane protein OmpA-like peptidoglycan-associated protein
VRDWLVAERYVRTAAIQGYGETRPVAPNEHADGSDDPEGRQRNRRVEIRIDACK